MTTQTPTVKPGRPRANSYRFTDKSRAACRRMVRRKIKTYLRKCKQLGTGASPTMVSLAAEMQGHTERHVPPFTLRKVQKLEPPINDITLSAIMDGFVEIGKARDIILGKRTD